MASESAGRCDRHSDERRGSPSSLPTVEVYTLVGRTPVTRSPAVRGSGSGGDLVIRKSRPILAGDVGLEEAGLFEGAAGCLHLIEKPEILLHAAIVAPLIAGEETDAARVGGTGQNGTRAIETRVIAGDGLGEATFLVGFGMEARFD